MNVEDAEFLVRPIVELSAGKMDIRAMPCTICRMLVWSVSKYEFHDIFWMHSPCKCQQLAQIKVWGLNYYDLCNEAFIGLWRVIWNNIHKYDLRNAWIDDHPIYFSFMFNLKDRYETNDQYLPAFYEMRRRLRDQLHNYFTNQ